MVNWCKKYFLPHNGNSYEPALLKTEATAFVLLVLAVIELVFVVPTFFLIPSQRFSATVLPSVIAELTNSDRLEAKLPKLKTNSLLAEAAQLKAEDMARRGYFSHVDPDGREPWYWFNQIGYRYSSAGENLAVNFFDSSEVEKAWMNSPAHRENILKRQFTEMGVGVAAGYYEGYNTLFIVQFFGHPMVQAENSSADFSLDQNFYSNKQLAAAGSSFSLGGFGWKELFWRLVTSPRLLTNIILAFFVFIILVIIILMMFSNQGRKKKEIFLNALLILIVILSVTIMNRELSIGHSEIAHLPSGAVAGTNILK